MNQEDLNRLLAIAIGAMGVLGIVGTIYLWSVYLRATVRSRLFLVMAVASSLITAGAGATLWPVALAIRQLPRLEPPLGVVLVAAGLILAFLANVVLAAYVYALRRGPRLLIMATEETQDQAEDRTFGDARRALELQHIEDEEEDTGA